MGIKKIATTLLIKKTIKLYAEAACFALKIQPAASNIKNLPPNIMISKMLLYSTNNQNEKT
jgi:hypothetical protein